MSCVLYSHKRADHDGPFKRLGGGDSYVRCSACKWHMEPLIGPANPWAGYVRCPSCSSSAWTLPWDQGSSLWRCVECHLSFDATGRGFDGYLRAFGWLWRQRRPA